MLTEALALAARGFRVFPCHTPRVTPSGVHCSCARADCESIGKHPRTPKGLLDSSVDEQVIRAWWKKWPDANVAVRTGDGLVVLDVDPRKGGTSIGLDLPGTLRVVTGGGGEHIYMTGAAPNSVELVGPGLDVRGDGGYVLAPGSLHESGRHYEWDVGGEETIAPAPQWFLRAANAKRFRVIEGGAEAVPDAFVSGGRNDAMTALAGSMRRRGFSAPSMVAALLAENALRCRPPLDEPEVRRIAEGVAKRYQPSAPVKGSTILGWSELATQLPPTPWLCKALGIAPGAPILVAGYGFSGKTLALQDLAVSVAAGIPTWGKHDVRRGLVVHLDYEQGRHLTQMRYQRIALSRGVWARELAGQIEVLPLPPEHLDRPGTQERLEALLEGKALAIVDSLKAAFPSLEENSSDARSHLDMLTRVSEKTQCAIIVIHHARKPNKDSVGGSKMAIRGSGAIYDACAGVFVLEGVKGKFRANVSHEKERNTGKPVDDFALEFIDQALPLEAIDPAVAAVTLGDGIANESGSMRYGLQVRVLAEQAATVEVGSGRPLERLLLGLISETPGLGVNRLAELSGKRKTEVLRTLALLGEEERVLVKLGANRTQKYYPAWEREPGED